MMELNLNFVVFCLTIVALCSQYFRFKLTKGNKKEKQEEKELCDVTIDIKAKKEEDGLTEPSSDK